MGWPRLSTVTSPTATGPMSYGVVCHFAQASTFSVSIWKWRKNGRVLLGSKSTDPTCGIIYDVTLKDLLWRFSDGMNTWKPKGICGIVNDVRITVILSFNRQWRESYNHVSLSDHLSFTMYSFIIHLQLLKPCSVKLCIFKMLSHRGTTEVGSTGFSCTKGLMLIYWLSKVSIENSSLLYKYSPRVLLHGSAIL